MSVYRVKIPKGTIIDINDTPCMLTKSLYAKSDGRTILLNEKIIETNVMKITEDNMEKTKMRDSMPPKQSMNWSYETKYQPLNFHPKNLHMTAVEILQLPKDFEGNDKLKKIAVEYLEHAFKCAIKDFKQEKVEHPIINNDNINSLNF